MVDDYFSNQTKKNHAILVILKAPKVVLFDVIRRLVIQLKFANAGLFRFQFNIITFLEYIRRVITSEDLYQSDYEPFKRISLGSIPPDGIRPDLKELL